MIVDIYTHILPPAVASALEKLGSGLGIAKRMKAVRDVHDFDSRFRAMDEIGEYRQIISLPNPPIEAFTTPRQAIDLARIANDGMADLVRKYPKRFPAFVAALPMHEVEPSLAEARRAIDQLGARGIQLFTNVNGKPIDAAEYAPLFALAAEYDLPIWLHPTRSAEFPDYTSEKFSRYEMWWCFGWPYETSVAMARLVFTGLFDRHPGIKIITHHGGGMIPFYDKRIENGLAALGGRTKEEDYSGVLKALKRPFMDYFHDFYADTALFGDSLGLDCALKFFGTDHMVFASDAPFGPIKLHTDAIAAREFDAKTREAIVRRNAEKLMKMTIQ
jgi:predicted TIM-barrel fold metal-dependent hydrolase